MDRHTWLEDITAAIADGATIDWPAIEERAARTGNQDLIERFRTLERITRFQASLQVAQSASPSDESLLHPLKPPANEDSPVQWGPLGIREKIGRGTFGDVYRAHDPRLDRDVALKLLRRRGSDQPSPDSAIIEEGRLLARVRHPNIVTVYGAERIEGRGGVWMELIKGHTLEEEVRVNGPFDANAVRQVGVELCSALIAVHQAGLLHRDLKAANVMRDETGRIVLTDFGAGREQKVAAIPENQMELAGTPLYLAPEVLAGAPASAQTEVYALGVLLFHLATGSYPVIGRTLRNLRDAHDGKVSSRTQQLAPGFLPELAAVIDRAIALEPRRRYKSAEELREALREPTGKLSSFFQRFWIHKWVILTTAFVFAAAAYLTGSVRMRYRAAAVVEVTGYSDRLASIGRSIMTDSSLRQIASSLRPGDSPDSTRPVVDQLRDNTSITAFPSATATSPPSTTVEITYTSPTAEWTMNVANTLAATYIAKGIEDFTRGENDADAFLSDHIALVSQSLKETEDAIRAVKPKNPEDVPGSLTAARDALQGKLKALLSSQEQARTRVAQHQRQIDPPMKLAAAAVFPRRSDGLDPLVLAGLAFILGFVISMIGATRVAHVKRRRRTSSGNVLFGRPRL